jgi:DNA-binding MarR family transcriptional regulator
MYKDLDPLLHSQLRLAIISLLVASEKAEFTYIKEETKATSGNISIQIKKLQEAGYIKVEKSFKNNYPNTSISITKKGLEAFETYVNNQKKSILLNSTSLTQFLSHRHSRLLC